MREIAEPIAARPYDGWRPDPRLLTLAGVDHVGWGGAARREAVGALLGMSAIDIADGSVTYTMPVTGWLAASNGRVQPGVLAMLADAAHAAGVGTTLPAGRILQTLDLGLDFVSAPSPGAGELRCRVEVGRSERDGFPVLSSAAIEDAAGTPVATATARTIVFEIPLGDLGPPPDPSELPPLESTPRPYLEPVTGQALPEDVLASTEPLERLRQLAAGELALPPIYHLTGLRPVAAERGEATFAIPGTQWLASFAGSVYGGVLGLLLEAAASGAVATMLSAAQDHDPVSIKVTFVRPVQGQGEPICATGRVVRCGRRVAVATAEVVGPDGKAVALATSTHAVRGGRG
jgi:acyl-CoA thioesterase